MNATTAARNLEETAMPRRPTPLPMPMLNRRRLLGGGLAVAAVAGGLPRPGAAQGGQVNVFNWDTYIGPDTIREFTAATGIAVRYDLFGSSDELFGRLREGNPGYDVIYPSNDYVERMIVADMLVPLDHARIPNRVNLEPQFTDPRFDPGRRFSMPYFWGTIGIGYRRTVAQPTSWAAVFDSDEHSGRISLLNDKNTIQAALIYLGYSLNTEDPAEIDEAAELLIRQKPHIKTFGPDNGQDLLIAGEVDVCLEWNGDILQVMEEDDELNYVVPKEGAMLWEDAMAIPTGGPNPDEAHEWINYILEAEVHGAIAEYIKYPLPNRAAKAFIPEEDLLNPAIYPPEEVMQKLEVSVYKGEAIESLYENALTRVLAA
jgi:spermidine/putrescine transport system substrate-binding protein